MTAQTGELPLAGLRTVVTGASSGIGRAIAVAFAAAGARVGIGFWRSSDAATALAAELGPGHPLVQADLGTAEGCAAIVRDAFEALGHVDVWVNNAGRGISRPVLALTDEDVDAMIRDNVKSVLYGVQAMRLGQHRNRRPRQPLDFQPSRSRGLLSQ